MRGKGLTLIEVLVVIVIIAALTAMAVPLLQKSKDQGKDLLCFNNLRQLGIALSIYSHENEMYPQGFCGDPSCHPSIPSDEYRKLNTQTIDWQNSSWWFHLLNGIIEEDFSKEGPLWCPSRCVSDTTTANNILCSNYGINYSICKITMESADEFFGMPLRTERVVSPSMKLLLMDSGYALISWKALAPDITMYFFENSDRQDSYFLPGAPVNQSRYQNGSINEMLRDDAVKGRHSSGRFNAVFADGHVDRTKPASVEPDFDAGGNFLNASYWCP
jgi:prepilin-type N-terminal cleavage/methylation domain-containing protein/prepilin-type processing-associated H-X9-DG protein